MEFSGGVGFCNGSYGPLFWYKDLCFYFNFTLEIINEDGYSCS